MLTVATKLKCPSVCKVEMSHRWWRCAAGHGGDILYRSPVRLHGTGPLISAEFATGFNVNRADNMRLSVLSAVPSCLCGRDFCSGALNAYAVENCKLPVRQKYQRLRRTFDHGRSSADKAVIAPRSLRDRFVLRSFESFFCGMLLPFREAASKHGYPDIAWADPIIV